MRKNAKVYYDYKRISSIHSMTHVNFFSELYKNFLHPLNNATLKDLTTDPEIYIFICY